jgi:hypothetical protein
LAPRRSTQTNSHRHGKGTAGGGRSGRHHPAGWRP